MAKAKNPSKKHKPKGREGLSLYPLSLESALSAALQTGKPHKKQTKNKNVGAGDSGDKGGKGNKP